MLNKLYTILTILLNFSSYKFIHSIRTQKAIKRYTSITNFLKMQSNDRIIKQAITWSATNSLIYTDGNLNWGHAPLALVPNSFPKESFNYIKKIQPIFNILVDSISRDKDFLTSTLSQASQADEFTKRLLDILHELPENSIKNSINLGIHRSDYMLQIEEAEGRLNNKILQVEINTIASSFGCLSRKIGFQFHNIPQNTT